MKAPLRPASRMTASTDCFPVAARLALCPLRMYQHEIPSYSLVTNLPPDISLELGKVLQRKHSTPAATDASTICCPCFSSLIGSSRTAYKVSIDCGASPFETNRIVKVSDSKDTPDSLERLWQGGRDSQISLHELGSLCGQVFCLVRAGISCKASYQILVRILN